MPLDPCELLTIAEACDIFGWQIEDLQTYLIAGGFVLAENANGPYKRPKGLWTSDLEQRELFHLYTHTNKVRSNSTELRLRSDHAYRVVCYAATEREWMASCPRPADQPAHLTDAAEVRPRSGGVRGARIGHQPHAGALPSCGW